MLFGNRQSIFLHPFFRRKNKVFPLISSFFLRSFPSFYRNETSTYTNMPCITGVSYN
ncbi:Hypothetical protein Eab7_2509 [Exiguobacterium antarcticum B7]|nr:Hypothetical protein Eab7_2509 [Exiguobacterium antarcticum B7]